MALALQLYLGLTAVSAPFWRRALKKRVARGKEDPARLSERDGRASQSRPAGQLLWIHALGLGEAAAMLAVIRAMIAARPGLSVLLTTNTRTAADGLARLGLPEGVIHQYAPMEVPGAVGRFLDHWRPDALVVAELDLWPLTLWAAHKRGLPMVMLNVLMTERRFRNRQKMAPLMRAVLPMFSRIVVQDVATAASLVALGAPSDRMVVGGILKAAAAPLPVNAEDSARLVAAIGTRPVWLAAAILAGEEARMLAAHRLILARYPDALMILAPRQMTDGDRVATAVSAVFGPAPRRSSGGLPVPAHPVYLSDSVGEMGLWYRHSPVAFIGHSLPEPGQPRLPGKNPFEAIAHDAAVLHGPDFSDFEASYADLDRAGGAACVADAEELADMVMALWSDPARQKGMVDAAAAVRQFHQAALIATTDVVLALLPVQPPGSSGS